jgi:hypothetical protein
MQKKGKKIKLRKQFNDILFDLYKKGHGLPKHKDEHNSTRLIHSDSTFKTYHAQCMRFVDFCYDQGVKYDMDKAFKLIPEYGKRLEADGKSPWTIYTAINAIAKAYGVSTQEFGYKPPKRQRASVARSRYATEMDKHFSVENNKNLITFCQCFGLRRRELEALTGDMMKRNNRGRLFVRVINGKGGKKRWVPFCGTLKEEKLVVDLMTQASATKVFPYVHSKADIHGYRSVYACKLYKMYARPTETLKSSEKYVCRKDKAGVVYDKKAMQIVSRALGHNRISVIANSYLHNI